MNWDWAAWGVVAGSVGTALGFVLKILPSKTVNRFIPVAVFLSNFAFGIGLVAKKFLDGTGIQVSLDHLQAAQPVALAGFFGNLFGLVKPLVAACGSAALLSVQRFIAEKALKPVLGKDPGQL